MLSHHAQRSLEVAATETLDRVRTDQGRAKGHVGSMLKHIEHNLFDPSLDVKQLKRRCGVRDNSIPMQFHAQLGQPPHAYIESCRLNVACRLLRDSELKVWQIAILCGYSGIQVFSRAFTRWSKVRPSAYRRGARRQPKKTVQPARRVARSEIAASNEAETLRRALDGELDAKQASRLIHRLLSLYPVTALRFERPAPPAPGPAIASSRLAQPREGRSEPVCGVPILPSPGPDYRRLLSLEEIETARAEALWEQIKDQPQHEQRRVIRSGFHFETRALFEVVRKGGLQQGRDDRQRGLEIADLLLDVATEYDADTEHLEQRNLQAAAWAWIGNARRLALDLAGAERALRKAEEQLLVGIKDPASAGDIAAVRATIQMCRRQYRDAILEATRALSLFEQAADPQRMGQALVTRAGLFRDSGDCEKSTCDVKRALGYLDRDDDYLRLTAANILALNYQDCGKVTEAAALLAKTRRESLAQADTELRLKLRWLEASIAEQRSECRVAEKIYREVTEAFLNKRRPGEAALAAIDLACMFWSMGHAQQTALLLDETVPALERMGLHADALAGLLLLVRAAEEATLSRGLFDAVRKRIDLRPAADR